MSGLTLGLLSLDRTSLRVIQESGSSKQKKYVARILPLVTRHHLLLVTLLLSNAVAVETMPIFLDRISDPLTAVLVSVTVVLFFGEVLPQALCSRYGLAIGYTLAPLVYLLLGLCFVITYPIAKLLDCMLGYEGELLFGKAELKVLVDLLGPGGLGGKDELSFDEVLIIKGALELGEKTVKDAMVSLENVFMLEIDSKLDNKTINKVIETAHSRIPIYEGDPENVVAVLLVKTLIAVCNQTDVTIRMLVQDKRFCRNLHIVWKTTPMYHILNEFQKGKSHLAVVMESLSCRDLERPSANTSTYNRTQVYQTATGNLQRACGIITLEDVLEELLQEDIIDETDVYVDVRNSSQIIRTKVSLSKSLPLFYNASTKSMAGELRQCFLPQSAYVKRSSLKTLPAESKETDYLAL